MVVLRWYFMHPNGTHYLTLQLKHPHTHTVSVILLVLIYLYLWLTTMIPLVRERNYMLRREIEFRILMPTCLHYHITRCFCNSEVVFTPTHNHIIIYCLPFIEYWLWLLPTDQMFVFFPEDAKVGIKTIKQWVYLRLINLSDKSTCACMRVSTF